MRVTVIDYKAGNLTSVLKTLRHLGAEPIVTDGDLALVETAERIVLPGVGHFAESGARFSESTEKVPHVGWNSLEIRPNSRLLAGVEPGEHVYFTHSYKAPVTADTAAITHYIEPFAAAVERGNVMGVQFHPEKSGATGLKILRNFLSWNAEGTK